MLQDRNKQIHHNPENSLFAQLLYNYSNTIARVTMHVEMKVFLKTAK
jgi:hypothetical protein